jgi:hypothetical protein
MNSRTAIPLLILAASLSSLLHGCATSQKTTAQTRQSSNHKGRTELWQQNCNLCHNARSSNYYSDEQWEVAMHHMRVRGSLTAHETREIHLFLQSAN